MSAQGREERVESLAGAIENLLQKHKGVQLATLVLGATDPQSLDHSLREGDYRHARTLLSAAVYELSDLIVNGGKDG